MFKLCALDISSKANYNIQNYIQGFPKKTQFLGILAITPLWKGLELKVGGVSKTSGNSLCDSYKIFCAYHIENFLKFSKHPQLLILALSKVELWPKYH